MSGIRYIDIPQPISSSAYEQAIEGIVHRNKHIPGLKAIYRFGNITSPGISDLDLLFVFYSGEKCMLNGLEQLPESHSALFTHGIMGIDEEHFSKNSSFTLWSDMHLIYGTPTHSGISLASNDELIIRIQTAIEFLVANFIDLHIQHTYRIIKLRAFLQHMKGLIYDLEYLGVLDGDLYNLLKDLKNIILNWFEQSNHLTTIQEWKKRFIPEFEAFFREVILQHPIYLPETDQPYYPIARNIRLYKSMQVDLRSIGFTLPHFMLPDGRFAFKLLNRLNRFDFTLPVRTVAEPILEERFTFLRSMKAYNRIHLPEFMTITTSITSKII